MLESFGLTSSALRTLPYLTRPKLAPKRLMGFIIPSAIFAVVASLGYGVFLAPFVGDVNIMGVNINGWIEPLRSSLPVNLPSMDFIETLTLSQVAHAAFWWYTHVEN